MHGHAERAAAAGVPRGAGAGAERQHCAAGRRGHARHLLRHGLTHVWLDWRALCFRAVGIGVFGGHL